MGACFSSQVVWAVDVFYLSFIYNYIVFVFIGVVCMLADFLCLVNFSTIFEYMFVSRTGGHLGFSIGRKSNNTWLADCNDHS
jgi:hypothetical protein